MVSAPTLRSSIAADVHHAVGLLELRLREITGALRFTGHTFRATGAIFLAEAGIELAIIQLFARWGSDAFKLYVAEAPLKRTHNLAQRALAAAAGAQTPARTPSVTLPAQPQSVTPLPSWELPREGDKLVLNTAAQGCRLARTEGRLHAVHPQSGQHARCGWHFAKSSFVETTSFDAGILCAACFKLIALTKGTQAVESASSSESS